MSKLDDLSFVADENFDFAVVKQLREKGFTVLAIAESFLVYPTRKCYKLLLIERPFYLLKIRILESLSIGFVCHTVVFC